MTVGSRRTRRTSHQTEPVPSPAIRAFRSAISPAGLARLAVGLTLWLVVATQSGGGPADAAPTDPAVPVDLSYGQRPIGVSASSATATTDAGRAMTAGRLAAATTAIDGPTIELADQTTFVPGDGEMYFDLIVDPGSVGGNFLSLTVHGVIDDEDALVGPLTPALNRLPPVAIGELPQPQPGHYRLTVPVRPGAPFDSKDRILLPSAGVYPITIELRSDEGPIATTVSHVVRLPSPDTDTEADTGSGSEAGAVAGPAGDSLVLILPVSANGLSVADTTALLVAHPTAPVTPLLDGASIEELQADASIASDFVAAMAGRPVLAEPTPNLDPSALAEIDQIPLYQQWRERGTITLLQIGLIPIPEVQLLDTRPTADGLMALSSIGVGAILNVNGPAGAGGTIVADGQRLLLLAADDDLGEVLAGDGGVHRSNRLLTILNLQDDRSPVILAPTGAEAATVDSLLRALTQPGAPRLVSITDLAGRTPVATEPGTPVATEPGTPVAPTGRLRPSERPEQDLRPVADVLWRVQQKLTTYEGFDPSGAAKQGGLTATVSREAADALSRDRTPEDRQQILDRLESTVDRSLGVVELHEGQPVTLAARSAPIPVVVESSADGPRKVMLRFRSDKVGSADQDRVIEIAPGTTSIDVELEARSLGVSPLEVSMWTPDGKTMLAATRFEVRSTAIPGLGLLATVGAIGLLAAWWFLDARRRRRESGIRAEVAPEADRSPEDRSAAGSPADQPARAEADTPSTVEV